MKKFLALLGVSLGLGIAVPATAYTSTHSDSQSNRAVLRVVTPDGEQVFTKSTSLNISDILDKHNISGAFKYEDGNDVLPEDKVELNDSETVYSNSASANESVTIDLELPVKEITTDELFVGEERVVTEGVVGKAIKTTIVTTIPATETEEAKEIAEDSLTVITKPVQKVVEKGTKERPVRSLTSENRSETSENTTANNNWSVVGLPAPEPTVGGSIVETAYQFIGVPYVFGGMSPSGFDCSGLTSYVFKKHGISLPRTAASQSGVGAPVSLSDARPGDLLILNRASHVGIYIGDGKLIHAPRPGKSVEVANLSGFSLDSIRRL